MPTTMCVFVCPLVQMHEIKIDMSQHYRLRRVVAVSNSIWNNHFAMRIALLRIDETLKILTHVLIISCIVALQQS